jgi:hypothetical protein
LKIPHTIESKKEEEAPIFFTTKNKAKLNQFGTQRRFEAKPNKSEVQTV